VFIDSLTKENKGIF